MEKRFFIALLLTMGVLIFSSMLAPKQPVPQVTGPSSVQKVTESPTLSPQSNYPRTAEMIESPKVAGNEIKQKFDGLEVNFIEELGAIKQVLFLDYKNQPFVLASGLFYGDKEIQFKKEKINNQVAEFSYKDKNKEIFKRFTFSKDKYFLDLEIEVRNLSNLTLTLDYPLIIGKMEAVVNPKLIKDLAIYSEGKIKIVDGRSDKTFKDAQFLAIRDPHFCMIVQPQEVSEGFVHKFADKSTDIGFVNKRIEIIPYGKNVQSAKIYIGPLDLHRFNAVMPTWAGVVNFGTFDFISQILLQVMELVYKVVHNWGVTIILVSLLIYLALLPFSLKQMRSMKEMQALQPKIEALRATYKDNPQKLNKEIMELYREHKVNPLSGCLPLLLQMPVFFALYQVMIKSVALKGASFLWIKDLTEPDRLIVLKNPIFMGITDINIIPILMAILMFFQQKLSMTSATSVAAEQQKIMVIVFPIMFGFIFYNMPSGLVIYWFVNSLLMLVQQLKMRSKHD